jgi:predicted HicB family RNase H-like nuclease
MILKHEGYIAEIAYEDGDETMHGATINTRAVLHFAGRDIAELKAAFADTIADYREWCRERGVEPEKPYSGAGRRKRQPVHLGEAGRGRLTA